MGLGEELQVPHDGRLAGVVRAQQQHDRAREDLLVLGRRRSVLARALRTAAAHLTACAISPAGPLPSFPHLLRNGATKKRTRKTADARWGKKRKEKKRGVEGNGGLGEMKGFLTISWKMTKKGRGKKDLKR